MHVTAYLALALAALVLVAGHAAADSSQVAEQQFPGERVGVASVRVGDAIYLFGGFDRAQPKDEVWRHDPVAGTLTRLPVTIPTPRAYAGAALGSDGHVYLFGGNGGLVGSVTWRMLDDIVRFDPVNGTMETLSARLPSPREGVAVAALGDEIYLFGGGGQTEVHAEILRFTPATGELAATEDRLPEARRLAGAYADPRASSACPQGCAVVMGGTREVRGFIETTADIHDTFVRYDPVGHRVAVLDARLPWREAAPAAAWAGPHALVVGLSDQVLRHDPLADTLTVVPARLVHARNDAGAAISSSGELFVYGGRGERTIERFTREPDAVRHFSLQTLETGAALAWTAPALPDPGSTVSYAIEAHDGGGWHRLATTAATSWTDSTSASDDPRVYRVRAENAFGGSPWSPALMREVALPCTDNMVAETAMKPCQMILQEGETFVRGWLTYRNWSHDVQVRLVYGHVEASRSRDGNVLESAIFTEPGAHHMTAPFVSYLSRYDVPPRENVTLRSIGGTAAFIVSATQTVNDHGDCGGPDSTPSARARLTVGVTCVGHMADGFVIFPAYAGNYAGDMDDKYAVSVDRGDYVTVHASVTGHTTSVFAREPGGNSHGTLLKPPVGASRDGTVSFLSRKTGDAEIGVQLFWSGSRVSQECATCPVVILETWDDFSTGPFWHALTVTVIPNEYPELVDFDAPRVLAGGDEYVATAVVWDPDGNFVSASAYIHDGPKTVQLEVSLVHREDGTTLVTMRGTPPPDLFEGWFWLSFVGHDQYGASVGKGISTYFADADCAPGSGDAEADGREFVAACTGSVHAAGDHEDVLVFHVESGERRVFLNVTGNVGMEVTAPDGTVRTAVNGAYVDWLDMPGTYRARVTPVAGYAPYTVTGETVLAPPPDGAVHLTPLRAILVQDGELTPVKWWRPATSSVTRVLDLPAAALDGAAHVTLRVYGSPGTCGDIIEVRVNGGPPRPHDPCEAWIANDTWGSLPLHLADLQAGTNEITLRAPTVSGFGTGYTVWTDPEAKRRTSSTSSQGGPSGEWLMHLLVEKPLEVDERVPADAALVTLVHTRDLNGHDARVTLTWSDGVVQQTLAPYAGHVRVARGAPGAPGPLLLQGDAVAAAHGAPLTSAHASVAVGGVSDCGTGTDLAEGMFFLDRPCAGSIGGTDAEDILLVKAVAGTHLKFSVQGAILTVRDPAGEPLRVVDGVAHDYASAAGTYEVRLLPATAENGAYMLDVEKLAADAPNAGVEILARPFAERGVSFALPVRVMDADYHDVAMIVTWGDGGVQRVPVAGHLPTTSTPHDLTHVYASPGARVVNVEAYAADGTLVGNVSFVVEAVIPDDCGAIEAPPLGEGLDSPPRLPAPGACWGRLGVAGDNEDAYELRTTAVADFSVRVQGAEGLELEARLLWAPAGSVGTTWSVLVTSAAADEDGVIRLSPSQSATNVGRYLLVLERVAGAGAYQVEVVT